MNRPKFRVWDIEEQKWYKPTYKAYMNELHDIHVDLDGGLLIRTIDDSGKSVTIHESMFEGRYELIQSTGLKDINGKDIYEGDILKVFVLCDIGPIARVIFKNGMFGIEDDMHGYGYDKGLYSLFQILSLRDAEIIGNIYEHSHLLEENAE